MADDETRVVLVKPGDVLLIGNVGQILTPATAQAISDGMTSLGLKAFVFAADIDLDMLPRAEDQ